MLNESQRYLISRLDLAKPKWAWKPGTAKDLEAWQLQVRHEIARLLGLHRLEAVALEPEYGESVELGELKRTPVTFASRHGYRAFGYFIEALGLQEVGPAMLCVPGHGAGVDAIVGLAEEPYQANFALQCAKRGYRVLALEPMSFGHRRSERAGPNGWTCEADAKSALMLGETLAGWRIWDAMRGIDLLQSLPDVDPGRIGVMGISGGGMISLWLAALDVRIRAAVVSGYFCTFRDSILSIDHCLDNFVPGILDVIEMPDFAGLVAPRALFVESGTKDSIFPLSGFRKAVERAKEVFAAYEAEQSFGVEEFEGEHEFRGGEAFEFLNKRL